MRSQTRYVSATEARTVYCYRDQTWIVGGKVARCGHRKPVTYPITSPACYACAHAGEPHPINCPNCH